MSTRRRTEGTTKTTASRPKKRGMKRASKLAATRRKLITAVAEIVGEEGYGNASVAKITTRAQVAQGTFYNYFESQQDLFDQLLPELGTRLLDHIRSRVAGHPEGIEREEIGFRAFFEFLAATPQFYRILNEAETISPKAFRDHMNNMIQGYLRALRRSQEQGGLPGYNADELDVIVCILLGARNYLSYHYMVSADHVGPAPDWIARAYMKFVTGGLFYGGTSGPTYRARRRIATESDSTGGRSARRIVAVGDSRAVQELRIQDSDRDSNGALRSGVLLDLASSTAELAAGRERSPAPKLLNLALSVLASTRSRRLVAKAHCERRSGSVMHVGFTIHEDRGDRAAIVTGQATFVAP